ncbi:hypothetical protein [Bradyrhizobium sp. ORS 285]|uniref:hypothetical protein n=1 Tax=Bradyrhizobium sp. ORS 285 TaxID=115808 RepID=UPI001111E17B|nr:hypothetical protein [Bradyrhizobium sp. ORS 285]
MNKAGQTAVKQTGVTVPKIAVATYDVSGGADGTAGSHGLKVYIPAKAIITAAWVDVVTTFASANSTATLAVQVESSGDLIAASAINAAGNPWNAGIHGCLPGNFALDGNALTQVGMAAAGAASDIKTTAVREITIVTGVQTLTAGKANVFVEYVQSD